MVMSCKTSGPEVLLQGLRRDEIRGWWWWWWWPTAVPNNRTEKVTFCASGVGHKSISIAVKVVVLLELNPVGNLPHRNGQRKAYIWPC